MMGETMDRNVLITGASRNIGRRLAELFAQAGYGVALNARRSDEIQEVARAIGETGGRAVAVPGDVGVPEEVARVVAEAEAALGTIDVVINNAVVRVQKPIEDTTFEEWKLVQAVSLDGPFNICKALIPEMRRRGWGRIVNIGGVSAQKGSGNRIAVVTCKSGIQGFSRGLATETAADGITVNTVSPGRIGTDRGEWTAIGDSDVIRAHYERNAKDIPVGRKGTLDELCGVILFLCSDSGAFITGQTINVNGGAYMS